VPPGGSSTGADVDSSGSRSAPIAALASYSASSLSPGACARGAPTSVSGSSVPSTQSRLSPQPRVAAHSDPVRGQDLVALLADADPVGSGVPAAKSSVESAGVISPVLANHRPITRLQRGISKPKSYTNGTV
jgi:hypothetical protein